MIKRDTEKNGFAMDDKLYHKKSDKDYKGVVMDGLSEIGDADDIAYNADTMQKTLTTHLLYYMIKNWI